MLFGCADNVITALKLLVLDWLENRAVDAAWHSMASALHPNLQLATQQVNFFFRGPVISMIYARNLGPEIAAERGGIFRQDKGPAPGVPCARKEKAVTKNFARVRTCTQFSVRRINGAWCRSWVP